jgi:hypothetical protein
MKPSNPPLDPGEQILMQSRAWLSRSGLARRGTLRLTNRRLVFEAGRARAHQVPLAQLQFIHPEWSRLLGLLPLAPNCVRVETRDAQRLRFAVAMTERDAWVAAIKSACYQDHDERMPGFAAAATRA